MRMAVPVPMPGILLRAPDGKLAGAEHRSWAHGTAVSLVRGADTAAAGTSRQVSPSQGHMYVCACCAVTQGAWQADCRLGLWKERHH